MKSLRDSLGSGAISALNRRTIKVFLPIVSTFFAVALLAAWITSSYERVRTETLLEEEASRHIIVYEEVLTRYFDAVVGDVRILARSVAMENYLLAPEPASRERLAREFVSLAEVTAMYDQIRLVDSAGFERVRTSFDGAEAVIVPDEELEDESGRYYFKEIIDLDGDTVYVSVLDLNVERGMIEVPFKPIIRIGTPIDDPVTGERIGVLLVNFLAGLLIEEIALASEEGRRDSVMLLNKEGYWLYAPDPGLAWGCMLPDREEISFPVRYPEVWETMTEDGEIRYSGRSGIFVSRLVDPASRLTARARMTGRQARYTAPQWWIVSRIEPEAVVSVERERSGRLKVLLLIITLASIPISVFLARSIAANIEYRNELETAALFDPLTKLPNRLLFADRYEMHRASAVRRDETIGLLFIDLDGFKEVNDNHGHDAGDELLIETGARLKSSLRSADTVARMGGDEFVVLLGECSSHSAAKSIAEKLRLALSREFRLSPGTVTVGASIGICLAGPNDEFDLEEMLKRADAAMYEVKRSGKGAVAFSGA